MKPFLYMLALSLVLVVCNLSKTSTNVAMADEHVVTGSIDISKAEDDNTSTERISFKSISEIVPNEHGSAWVEIKDSVASLVLCFDPMYKDTLSFSYSPECVLMFPFKIDNNKIIVYWDNNMDTKYEFDIVKAINALDRKYIGKPFLELELANDTTLKATYLLPDLIKRINRSNRKRTFFPDKFIVTDDLSLYL